MARIWLPLSGGRVWWPGLVAGSGGPRSGGPNNFVRDLLHLYKKFLAQKVSRTKSVPEFNKMAPKNFRDVLHLYKKFLIQTVSRIKIFSYNKFLVQKVCHTKVQTKKVHIQKVTNTKVQHKKVTSKKVTNKKVSNTKNHCT